MKQVFIVTVNCHDSYGIQKVFSSKESAEQYILEEDPDNDDSHGYGMRIETHELND